VVVIRDWLAPRLTRDEITALRGRKFHHFRNVPMSTGEAEARELIQKYGALVRYIVSSSKLVVHRQALLDREDMYAIGCVMMIQSVEMYEEDRGTKLSTWIAMRVRQGLMAVVNELHGTLKEEGGRSARGEQVAWARGDEARKVFVESLDEPVGTGGHGRSTDAPGNTRSLVDIIASEDDLPDERLESHQEREWLMRAIEEVCTPVEKDIVYRILAGEPGQSIGDRHGIARQRVDQIHQKAILKLAKRRKIEDVQRERRLRATSA
jgi:RNA polymerase sigma factor for flagellar operon FliA